MSQVSEQVLSSLLAKQVLAASPGVASTDLYYSSTNSKKEIIPSTTYVGRYVQSLQSLRWGSSSQIVIPSIDLMGPVYLRIQINKPANAFVSQGWGYLCINSISYIWGSTNTSQLTITQPSILSWLATTSEPMNEQMSEILYQGGEATAVPPGGDYASASVIEATLLLPLPMSTLCPHKPPFDQSLLSSASPMIIRIDLASSASNVIASVDGNVTTAIAAQTQVHAADVIFTNTTVLDTSLSLSAQLRADPSLISAYPFIHLQSFQSPVLVASNRNPGVVNTLWGGLTSTPQTVSLNSFLRSDLIGISFTLTDQADLTARTAGAADDYPVGTIVAPAFNPIEMLDIEVTYNGQRLFYCPGYSSQLIGMRGRRGANYFTTTRAHAAAALSNDAVYKYPVTMFTTYKGASDVCDSFDQPNTSRYPNQVLNVSFRSGEVIRNTAPQYILNCTFIYSALAEVDSSGRCSLIFS